MSSVLAPSPSDTARRRDRLVPAGKTGAGIHPSALETSSDALGDLLSGIADVESPPDHAAHLTSLNRELRRLRRRKVALEPLAWAATDPRSPRSARARLRIVRRRLVELSRRRADALTDVIEHEGHPVAAD